MDCIIIFLHCSKFSESVNQLPPSFALFPVNNGARQVLSPILFSVKMDGLSKQLDGCKTGCLAGNSVISHLICDDDLGIFTPHR